MEAGQGQVPTPPQSSRCKVTLPGPHLSCSGNITPLSDTQSAALSMCTPLYPGVGHVALFDEMLTAAASHLMFPPVTPGRGRTRAVSALLSRGRLTITDGQVKPRALIFSKTGQICGWDTISQGAHSCCEIGSPLSPLPASPSVGRPGRRLTQQGLEGAAALLEPVTRVGGREEDGCWQAASRGV